MSTSPQRPAGHLGDTDRGRGPRPVRPALLTPLVALEPLEPLPPPPRRRPPGSGYYALESQTWPPGHRPACPACAQPTTGLRETYQQLPGVKEPVILVLAVPCACPVPDHVQALQPPPKQEDPRTLYAGDEDLAHSQQHPELDDEDNPLGYPCLTCDAPAGQACAPSCTAR